MHKLSRLVLATVFAAACGSDEASSLPADSGFASYLACDPFAAVEDKPSTLGTVLAAGKDAAGTIYVVNTADQVFISVDGVLTRQRIAGSGTGPDFWVFSIAGRTPPLAVQVNKQPDGSLRMGVFTGELTTKTFVIGQQGEELTPIAAADVAILPTRDLTSEMVLEYAATLPDGRYLVVIRPRDDWTFADFRLFLGEAAQLNERKVSQVVRFKDGGSTTIDFEIDGAPATASFPVVSVDGKFADGPASLKTKQGVLPLTRLTAAPADASYQCGS